MSAAAPAAGGRTEEGAVVAAAEALDCPTDCVRNVCILAHVDHGKTTCADNLISANGIISRHSAGKVRYLDSRRDEQERQITMKSSAIALKWAAPGRPVHTVNLIDSPGHVDFTSEVSTAARLADGALVVVDVVEGVEAQTRTVLRQAWRDRVKTCLVLNKVDRLIVELELTPLEAYQRMLNIVEQVNAINQQLLSEELMAKDTEAPTAADALEGGGVSGEGIDLTTALGYYDEAVEEAWRYSPERGNVAFASGYHGWAFRIGTFAELIAGKMGAKPAVLHKVLWGEWSFNPKTKRALRRSAGDTRSKPMFVQFVLEQLWRVYGACYKALDMEQLGKMQAQIPAWKGVDLTRLVVGVSATRELMSRWLPFADSVLEMAVEHLPSPRAAAPDRLPVLCPRWFASAAGTNEADPAVLAAAAVRVAVQLGAPAAVVEGLQASDAAAPVVVYLAKFLSADLERHCLAGDVLLGEEELQFVGICRVFSGTMRPNQDLPVMSSADGGQGGSSGRALRVHRLFALKGRFLEEVPEAPAGAIIAAQVSEVYTSTVSTAGGGGRDASELAVERCLTLCSVEDGPCFETPYGTQAFAIVRVNIEPQRVADADALYRGLRLLHRADPSVTIDIRVTGENLLGCCGDEHLKRCITDLQNLYARGVPLSISPPLVAIRESLASSVDAERLDPKAPMWLPSWASHLADASTEASSHFSGDHEDGTSDAGGGPSALLIERFSMSSAGVTSAWTANRKVCVRIGAMALPAEVLEWMDANADVLETVVHRQRASPAFVGSREAAATLAGCFQEISRQFDQRMADADGDGGGGGSSGSCSKPGSLCGLSVAKGSRTVLLDATGGGWKLGDEQHATSSAPSSTEAGAEQPEGAEWIPNWMRPSLLAGYQFASGAGPLCEEPMRGVAFVIHSCHVPRGAAGPAAAPVLDQSAALAQQPRPGEVPAVAAAADEAPTAATLAMTADPYGPMSGQLMVATKEACRCCLFRKGFARISEAMLSLEVQCEQEMLGKVYAVLGKRRVKVLEEGLRDGTSMFYINSHLPLADSFGLAHSLRTAASGQVSFHCAFSHWEQSEDDPFQEVSLTAEEIEELGDQTLPPNMAKKLIDAIRKRKGLATDEKVVKEATKQRTVTRNK